jgi:hypothetical protein
MIRALARRLRRILGEAPARPRDDAVGQKILLDRYRALRELEHRPSFRDVGFSLYSQHDEDGILLYAFGLIGASTHRSVEICAGDGIECNTANLLINHRWTGLLVDGDPGNVRRAREYYRARPETRHWPPQTVAAWVTRENVNEVVRDAGFSGEIDLLSLDVDGVDYWLWEALTAVAPRIVVLEYNHLLGPDVSLSVPYRPDFVAEFTEHGSDYAGASLQAFVRLGRKKGYRFVGANAVGTNAFFAREDVPARLLPEADPRRAFDHPRAQFGMKVRYPGVRDKEWVEV